MSMTAIRAGGEARGRDLGGGRRSLRDGARRPGHGGLTPRTQRAPGHAGVRRAGRGGGAAQPRDVSASCRGKGISCPEHHPMPDAVMMATVVAYAGLYLIRCVGQRQPTRYPPALPGDLPACLGDHSIDAAMPPWFAPRDWPSIPLQTQPWAFRGLPTDRMSAQCGVVRRITTCVPCWMTPVHLLIAGRLHRSVALLTIRLDPDSTVNSVRVGEK